MLIKDAFITVRVINLLKYLDYKYEWEILHVVLPYGKSFGGNRVTARLLEEFNEFKLEMRMKYL